MIWNLLINKKRTLLLCVHEIQISNIVNQLIYCKSLFDVKAYHYISFQQKTISFYLFVKALIVVDKSLWLRLMRISILFVIRIINNRYWVALSMEVGLTMLNITVRFHHSQIETQACVLDPLSSLIYAMWPSHQVHIFKSWTFGWLDHGLLLI